MARFFFKSLTASYKFISYHSEKQEMGNDNMLIYGLGSEY